MKFARIYMKNEGKPIFATVEDPATLLVPLTASPDFVGIRNDKGNDYIVLKANIDRILIAPSRKAKDEEAISINGFTKL